MTTSEKVAYLKGLADGLGLGDKTKEEKLLAAIIDTLECIAQDIEELDEVTFDLGDEIDAISEDLSEVESVVFDEDYDEDYDDDDDDFEDHHGHGGGCCGGHGGHDHGHGGGCCGGHGGHGHHGVVMYEVTCPACDNTITIDEDIINLGSIECPNCGGLLEFDFEDEDEAESGEEK